MRTTRDARLAAADWVREEAAPIPEFVGALVAGSARVRAPEEPHPPTSDVDVWVVVDAAVLDPVVAPEHRFAVRKLHYRGVILERAFFSWETVADPTHVLGDPYLAPNLAAPVLLADPTGRLQRLAEAVRAEFPRRAHVRRRVEAALGVAAQFWEYALSGATPPAFHPLVSRPAGLLVGLARAAAAPPVAALAQPTTRRAFVLAGEILRQHGRPELAEALLSALGSVGLAVPEVERALAELEQAYDAAVEVRRTIFGLDYNVSREGRDLAIGGVREVAADHPREAMYPLTFLRSLVQNVLEHDASAEVRDRFREGFVQLLSSLGLDTDARRAARVARIREELLPELRAGCEEILSGTPGILEDGARERKGTADAHHA